VGQARGVREAAHAPAGRELSARVRWTVFIALALLALAIRLPQLGQRPMHTDEAVNAYLTGEVLSGESFHYDPQDRHGPALIALAAPLARSGGAHSFSELTAAQLRLTPVLLGSATVLLFGAAVELFGFLACLIAAILFAMAPLPVYYNRYFIHETLLVAATLGLIVSGGRMMGWSRTSAAAPRSVLVLAAVAGGCAGLMLACKETALIHFLALAVVLLCAWWLPPRQPLPPLKAFAVALGVMFVVVAVLFTWFGRNGSALSDLGRALPRLAARAGGEGHAKAFGYYFHLLDPMLVLFIVAAGGAYAAICDAVNRLGKSSLLLVIYGLVILAIYSAIPYKTPWLALNLWLPLALVCGLGAAAFWEQINNTSGRWVVGIAGAFLLAALGVQTKLLAFDRPVDELNPYAYAQTGEDLAGLPIRLAELAGDQHLARPRIAVIAADAWPLPWYLRQFDAVGYWQPGQNPGPADFFITAQDVPAALTDPLKNFRPEYFGVRPGVLVILWTPTTRAAAP